MGASAAKPGAAADNSCSGVGVLTAAAAAAAIVLLLVLLAGSGENGDVSGVDAAVGAEAMASSCCGGDVVAIDVTESLLRLTRFRLASSPGDHATHSQFGTIYFTMRFLQLIP